MHIAAIHARAKATFTRVGALETRDGIFVFSIGDGVTVSQLVRGMEDGVRVSLGDAYCVICTSRDSVHAALCGLSARGNFDVLPGLSPPPSDPRPCN
jgi:hypothetical protein